MNDHRTWRPVFRAMCPEPGPRDLFLVILVNGRHINFHSVTEYSKLRNALEKWATEYKCHIKMLPMGSDELMNYLNIAQCDPQPIENMDPEFRAQAVQNCLDSLRDSVEPDERDQALDLLRALPVLARIIHRTGDSGLAGIA